MEDFKGYSIGLIAPRGAAGRRKEVVLAFLSR